MRKDENTNISLKTAVIISAASKYSNILVALVINAVLARLVTAEEFGIIAIITVFTNFFSVFSDMGIGSGVIQNRSLDERDIKNIFAFTFYLGIGIAFIFALCSIPISKFYNDNIFLTVGPILSLSLLFNTINGVPNAILLKQKKFVTVAVRTVTVSAISGVTAIMLSFMGWGAYAIVVQSVMAAMITFLWNYASIRIGICIKPQWASLRKISGFSTFQFLFNFVNYFSRNLDNLLIGKFMGKADLGYYDKAYKLMGYPISNLTHAITPALHPVLSNYQDDLEYIYNKYMNIVKILSLLGIYVSVLCFFCSDNIIQIIYGNNWNEAIPCFKLLSLAIWAQMITSSSGSIFQSAGKTNIMFISGGINALINIVFIFTGIMIGDIKSVSFMVMMAYNIHFIVTFIFMCKCVFKKSYFEFLKDFIPDILILALMFLGGCLFPFQLQSIYINFGIRILYFSVIYFFAMVVTKQYKVLLFFIKKR